MQIAIEINGKTFKTLLKKMLTKKYMQLTFLIILSIISFTILIAAAIVNPSNTFTLGDEIAPSKLNQNFTELYNRNNDLDTLLKATIEAELSSLSTPIANLEATANANSTPLSYTHYDQNTLDFKFNGVNVYIQNGTDSTAGAPNGYGNLIIGYNATPIGGAIRTGSHNLIVGDNHQYSSFGSAVFGFANTISGQYATVTGGTKNIASKIHTTISGSNYYAGSASPSPMPTPNCNTSDKDWCVCPEVFDNGPCGNPDEDFYCKIDPSNC